MADERQISIRIGATNETNQGFDAARQKLLGVGEATDLAKRNVDAFRTSWAGMATSFMAGAIMERGASALMAFSTKAIDLTGDLADLSGKTGISAEALQRLAFVTSQSGVPLEQVAQGAVKMGRALVEGNTSAVAAVKALGLQVDTLIKLGPERAFLAIGEAIAGVPNPMERAALATAVFGKAGADYLPAFTTNMTELADEAQRSGTILDDDLVAAGDAAGDALGRLALVGDALMARVLIPMLPAVEMAANWLGTALPAALDGARDAVDWLLRQGMALNVWFRELAVQVSETVADVPVLGRVFGQSAADIETLRTEAQFARDALNAFNVQGVRPVREAVAVTAPLMTSFGEEIQKTGRKGKQAAEDVGIVWGELGNIVRFQIAGIISPALQDFETDTNNAEEALADLRDELHRVAGTATQVAPVLANTMKLPWVELQGTVHDTGTATDGFFTKVFGGAEGLGQSISAIFSSAFEGGGGALGAIKSFATQGLSALLAMIPGVGPFVSAFAGPLISMFEGLIRKSGDFFRSLFGGPSSGELNDRNLVKDWEDMVIGASENAQRETERWAQVVVAVTEAYIRNGRTAEEAERDVRRAWESREGGEETWRVIDEINRKMQEQAAAAADWVGRIGEALNDLPDEVRVRIRGEYEAPDLGEGFATGTMGRFGTLFHDFGAGTLAPLHGREMVVPYADRFEAAAQILAEAARGAGAAQRASTPAAAPNIYIAIDTNGQGREVTEAQFHEIQRRLSTGGLFVPARAIVAR